MVLLHSFGAYSISYYEQERPGHLDDSSPVFHRWKNKMRLKFLGELFLSPNFCFTRNTCNAQKSFGDTGIILLSFLSFHNETEDRYFRRLKDLWYSPILGISMVTSANIPASVLRSVQHDIVIQRRAYSCPASECSVCSRIYVCYKIPSLCVNLFLTIPEGFSSHTPYIACHTSHYENISINYR